MLGRLLRLEDRSEKVFAEFGFISARPGMKSRWEVTLFRMILGEITQEGGIVYR